MAAALPDLSFNAPPRISQALFCAVLTRRASPAAPDGPAIYATFVRRAKDPAVALAFFGHESQFGTFGLIAQHDLKNWGAQRRAMNTSRGVRVTAINFFKFTSWTASAEDWCDLIDGYIARGLDTVGKALPVYAPSSDGNKPAAYIAAIVGLVAQWQKDDTAMTYNSAAGWCPFADRKPAADGNYSDANSPSFGRIGFDAEVMHVTAGKKGDEFARAVAWFQTPDAETSAHFTLGKRGEIAQHVSIFDVAYANGLSYLGAGRWQNPRGKRVTPSWRGLRPGVNPNRTTVSFEHAGQPGEPWTAAMLDANTRLLQWVGSLIASLRILIPHQNLIGHYELDPLDRPNCPSGVVDFDDIARRVNNVQPVTYRVKAKLSDDPNDNFAAVREGRGINPKTGDLYPIALGGTARLLPGQVVQVQGVVDGWAHLEPPIGFVRESLLERVQ